MILMHGIPEEKNELVSSTAVKVIFEHLSMPGFNATSMSRCYSLGHSNNNKPRPILIKFLGLTLKNT